MEVFIILIVIGILSYVIYQSMPDPKFQKAKSLFDSGNLIEAEIILNSIFEKHPEAPAKLAECKLAQGLIAKSISGGEAKKYFNQIIAIGKKLPSKASVEKYELVEAKAFLEITQINFNDAIAFGSAEGKVKKLKENLRFIDNATKVGIEGDFKTIRKKSLSELADVNFTFGIQSEKSEQFPEAILQYSIAKDFSFQSDNSEIHAKSIIRTGICRLKNKEHVDAGLLDEINKVSADRHFWVELKRDFFYRLAKKLLEDKKYEEAEKLINENLNFVSPAIDKIKELLNSKQIENAIKKVNEINSTIEQLYENSFPVEDVKILYEALGKRITEIKSVIPSLANKLEDLRPSLFNRLLTNYISAKQFANAINLIQSFPSFWESPELLKDLGICCYEFTAHGKLSEDNYQIVISNWLTAVFYDKVILKSLEQTNWDDAYTFTLTDAIGSKFFQYSDLPDNVNYDDISDLNISIGTTQRVLLEQFETLIHQVIPASSLSKSVNDFYTKEKNAIQKIVSIIDNEILFAAPLFSKTVGINENIIRELDSDYIEYSNEESLDAGIPYLKNKNKTEVSKYAAAKELVTKMTSAIMTENLAELKALSTENNKSLIGKFKTINNSVEDLAFNAFKSKIEANDENGVLIPLMGICIGFVGQNEKLKSQCSIFIHDYCDSKWKTKSPVFLLELMIKSVKYNPNNYRAAKSITILINNNLMDIVNDNTTDENKIYTLIYEVINIKSEVLKNALKELLELRKKVLASMGTEKATTVLMGYNLNSNGMKFKKVLDTMHTLGGGATNSLF